MEEPGETLNTVDFSDPMELLQTLDLAAVGRSFGFAVPPHIDLGVGYRFDHNLILVLFPLLQKNHLFARRANQ